MKILITGATGFVGTQITKELLKDPMIEHIYLCSRSEHSSTNDSVTYIKWNPLDENDIIAPEVLASINGVINLMGENIASGRWSEARKKSIYDSRVKGSSNLIKMLNKYATRLEVFTSTSAIGIYQANTDEHLNEQSSTDTQNFLAKVCRDWEACLDDLNKSVRKVVLRVGVVFGHGGGAISKMLLPFKLGLGGILGNGKQTMSWIHLEDLAGIYIYSLKNKNFSGIYNAVSPEPVSNYAFTKQMGSTLNRPTIFPVPAFLLKILFGEMSSVLLDSHYVVPQRLESHDFEFKYGTISTALDDILK